MMPKPSWLGLKNADAVIVSMFGRVQVQNAWSEMREGRGLKSVYCLEGTPLRVQGTLHYFVPDTKHRAHKDWAGLGWTGTFVVVNVTSRIDRSPGSVAVVLALDNSETVAPVLRSGVRSNMLAGHWELETKGESTSYGILVTCGCKYEV